MIKKLIILALIIWGLFFLYKKFIASDVQGLQKRKSSVDVLGVTGTDQKYLDEQDKYQ
jgi:hypothetical protein